MSHFAELKTVTKMFDNTVALDNVDLKVEEGEILALLGPNGSGKSTLLKILALLENPTRGEVYFHNAKISNQNRERTRMETTMVFQKATLFNTTVYNNIAYGLKIRKVPKNEIQERVNMALKLVRLEGFQKKHAKKLSGGEQQRVALARALILNTKLLLLDEPTANLDPKNASIIEEIITSINREHKTTIVIATHNMFQAKRFPHRIALMENGKINEIGKPAEVFSKLSKTLASFAALENVFTGNAKTATDGTTIVDIGDNTQLIATGQHQGQVSLFISPEDIILSKNPFDSSARNMLKGRIVEIQDLDSLVKLKVDVGKLFTVQITKHSFDDMKLNLNAEVYMAFKASSVKII
ncbi:ABC transporter ATP-binding protein [Candidatus Bathyarchaeota archaeon]|nr:ABC transporter ATP-binding protein [Candidatus Bathyarchaeota archaeon]